MADREVLKNNSNGGRRKHKGTCRAVMVCTPLLVLVICCAVVVLAGYSKFNYVKDHANLIFNKNTKTQTVYKDNEYRVSDAPNVEGDLPVKEEDDDVTHKITFPYFGDEYAKLTIDNKEADIKEEPVIWGLSDSLLERGVCQACYSAYIGATGRVVLCAHNHTYFYGLPKVKVGDKVTLTTSYGKFVYKVKETKVLNEKDTSLLYYNPVKEPITDDLILYTCWNNGYMGMSDERLYLICSVVSKDFNE